MSLEFKRGVCTGSISIKMYLNHETGLDYQENEYKWTEEYQRHGDIPALRKKRNQQWKLRRSDQLYRGKSEESSLQKTSDANL